MSALKYLLLGVAADAAVLAAFYLFLVVSMAVSLRGKCPDIGLDSFERDCPPSEAALAYLEWPYILLLIVVSEGGAWWLVPALLVLPLAGLCYGLFAS